MAKYQYRILQVSDMDAHFGNPSKARRGKEPDRYYLVEDMATGERTFFRDEVGDDQSAFAARATRAFTAYLDALGADGWQIIQRYYPPVYTHLPFSGGQYMLMREVQ